MTDSLPTIEQTSQEIENDLHSKPKRSLKFALLFAAGCFALALAVALTHNLRQSSQAMATLFDSNAYLMSVTYVLKACHQFASGELSLDATAKSIVETIMLNGPIMPGLGAIYFTLIGREPSLLDMRAPIFLEAVIHAASAFLLALVGWRFTGGRLSGLFAGVVLAIYPSAVTSAARFMSETVTVFLTAAGLLACSYLPIGRKNFDLQISTIASFFFAVTSSLLVLTKAALMPGVFAAVISIWILLALAKIDRRSFFQALCASSLGVILVFSPWLMFTKIATGNFCLLPQRGPTFNLAAGLNPETDGWSALPETPMVSIFSENDGPRAAASAFYKLNPGDFYGRMARKPARLLQYPWNDCRFDVLGIPLGVQVILHQLLLVFGLFGALSFCTLPIFVRKRKEENLQHPELETSTDSKVVTLETVPPLSLARVLIGIFSILLLAGHLAYVPFVASTRYGFTAIPSVILFAIWCISGRWNSKVSFAGSLKLLIAAAFIMLAFTLDSEIWRSLFASSMYESILFPLAIAAVFLFIGCLMAIRALLGTGKTNVTAKALAFLLSFLSLTIMVAAALAGKSNTFDWEAKLTKSMEFGKIVKLPNKQIGSAIVLVNLRGDWRAARLKVNNRFLDASPISLMHITGNMNLSNAYRTFAKILRTDTSGLEQWRAFIVPSTLLKPGEENSLLITANQENERPASITGSTINGAHNKTIFGPSLSVFAPTKLLNNPLCLDPRLREVLPQSTSFTAHYSSNGASTQNTDLSEAPGIQKGAYHLCLLTSEKPNSVQIFTASTYVELKGSIAKPSIRASKTESQSVFTAEGTLPSSCLSQPHTQFVLTGEVDADTAVDFKVCLDDLRLLAGPVDLAIFPTNSQGKGKRAFKITGLARTDSINRDSARLMIRISSDHVPLSVSNLRLKVEPLKAPELTISGKSWF